MSKKGIILMLGAAIAAGFAGYKVGSKKHYCSLCDGPEFEVDDEELEEQADEDDVQAAEAETRRIITKQMLGEIRDNGKLREYIRVYHSNSSKEAYLFSTTIKGVTDRMSVGNVQRIIKKYAALCQSMSSSVCPIV